VRRVICIARCDAARLQIEEDQVREDEAGVHGSLSPMRIEMLRLRAGHACLRSHEAVVQRGKTRVHTSYAHVHRDLTVVH
jgi:hypothetical protein